MAYPCGALDLLVAQITSCIELLLLQTSSGGPAIQPQVGVEVAAGANLAGMPLNGGPPVHQRYRAGLKDPAEMEHLMRKRQKEAEQAAILQEQVRLNQLKKKKAAEDKKRQDALDEARIQREREELRRDHEKEIAERKHKEQREQLEQQIKEKQAKIRNHQKFN